MLLIPLIAQAQRHPSYYQSAKGANGYNLKTALFRIISEHEARSYKQLWQDFKKTDVRPDGKIWDIYSNATNYTPGGSAQGANYKKEGDSYNREHSFPKSWFDDGHPMYTDLFHLYPSDGYVNNRRSNYPFGETNGETYTSKNGYSKLGSCTTPGYNGTVFEPNDELKGDLARTYFYMATAYEDKIASWHSPMLAGNKYPAYAKWAIDMLLHWAQEDPVSEKEIARNEAVYQIQRNRNPFIDYPGLEQYIWGSMTSTPFDPENYGTVTPQPTEVAAPVFSTPSGTVTAGTKVTISCATAGATIHYTINQGQEQTKAAPVEYTVNETTHISAYARLGEKQSQTVTAQYTVQSTTPEISQTSDLYVMLTDESKLRAGMPVLILCNEKKVAMAEQGNNIRNYVNVEPSTEGSLTTKVNGQGLPYAFVLGGTTDAWTLTDPVAKVFVSLNKSENKIHTSATADTPNAQWTITLTTDGIATIENKAIGERFIQYNPSSPRFACYKGSQSEVSLYGQPTATDIQQIEQQQQGVVTVYDLAGRFVCHTTTLKQALQQLPQGLYVINGKKVWVR
ncbi:endonuclease I [gut metagenome]|uniref:Endonuclease I n=1 Tax=gut metagenome TaxID=749906 RepID=J9FAH7_9ZZZZ